MKTVRPQMAKRAPMNSRAGQTAGLPGSTPPGLGSAAAAGEVAADFRSQAVAGESDTAVPDAAGRQLSGPEREHFGFRESGVGEEPSSDGAGPGTGGGARTQDALHQVRTANAGLIGGQAGPAAEPRDQTAGSL